MYLNFESILKSYSVFGYAVVIASLIPVRPSARRVPGIVYPYELAQGVVLVCRNVPVPGLARYVPPAVIRVCQVERVCSAPLRYRRYQGCRRVRPIRGRISLYVPVHRIVFVTVDVSFI